MMSIPLLSNDAVDWVLGVGTILGAGYRYGYRPMKRKVLGWRESFTLAATSLAALKVSVANVEAELRPNGGSSLRDAVNRIDSRLTIVSSAQRTLANVPSNAAVFETNALGELLWANQNWLDLARQPADEAMGWGWLNGIHQEERDAVREEWIAASRQKRAVSATFRLCAGECSIPADCNETTRRTRGCTPVRFYASPVISSGDALLGYIAVAIPL